ncbi:Ger(x)C family spore germination protein [Clostridium sp. D2Q-11]|uniref:Ger(X)C family spore germination protein n=1 Tax=Anaeromonas frigoriresistens TaxID=2683708 RepID=A0A942UVB7_9FIRM|nr:Ger(x)C family spore germination protein [Anaeromonas frigoriresistens]MBS4539263.1 Ger(x)C family spore germination protein [Anaeromonas frigoriresistens]
MIKRIILLVIILLSITGCWDNKDITKQTLVVGMGIDKGQDKEYKVTLQLVKPSALQQNGKDKSEKPYLVISAEGDTIFEAIREHLKKTGRKAYFSHNRVIVICEDIAKKELSPLLDFIDRDPETRLSHQVLISKDMCAEDVLKLESDLEPLPAIEISQIMDNSETTSKLISATIFDILSRTGNKGFNSVIGVIQPNNNKVPSTIKELIDTKIQGGAVFKEDKLIAWLGPIETRALQFISGFNGDINSGLLIEPYPGDPKKRVSIELISLSTDLETKLIGEDLKLFINTKSKGVLAEQESGENLNTEENLLLLEQISEEKIKSELENIINIAQKEIKTDFLGISEQILRQEPKYWKKIESEWDEIFTKMDVTINVDFEINKTGLTSSPIISK